MKAPKHVHSLKVRQTQTFLPAEVTTLLNEDETKLFRLSILSTLLHLERRENIGRKNNNKVQKFFLKKKNEKSGKVRGRLCRDVQHQSGRLLVRVSTD